MATLLALRSGDGGPRGINGACASCDASKGQVPRSLQLYSLKKCWFARLTRPQSLINVTWLGPNIDPVSVDDSGPRPAVARHIADETSKTPLVKDSCSDFDRGVEPETGVREESVHSPTGESQREDLSGRDVLRRPGPVQFDAIFMHSLRSHVQDDVPPSDVAAPLARVKPDSILRASGKIAGRSAECEQQPDEGCHYRSPAAVRFAHRCLLHPSLPG